MDYQKALIHLPRDLGASFWCPKKLILLIILLAVISTACGGGERTPLEEYSKNMNPLLQKHIDRFEETGRLVERLGNVDAQASSGAAIKLVDEVVSGVDDLTRKMRDLESDWALVVPPSDAVTFHGLVLDMMLKRTLSIEQASRGYGMMGLALESAASGAESQQFQYMDQARSFLTQAEGFQDEATRLFSQVLIEAEKLGGIEVERR